mgnify:CR=1 FL=1
MYDRGKHQFHSYLIIFNYSTQKLLRAVNSNFYPMLLCLTAPCFSVINGNKVCLSSLRFKLEDKDSDHNTSIFCRYSLVIYFWALVKNLGLMFTVGVLNGWACSPDLVVQYTCEMMLINCWSSALGGHNIPSLCGTPSQHWKSSKRQTFWPHSFHHRLWYYWAKESAACNFVALMSNLINKNLALQSIHFFSKNQLTSSFCTQVTVSVWINDIIAFK